MKGPRSATALCVLAALGLICTACGSGRTVTKTVTTPPASAPATNTVGSTPAAPPPTNAAPPTLGRVWSTGQQGYGQVEPSTVFNGGDPTGMVSDIRWQQWGQPTATGDGTGWYVPQNVPVSGGHHAPAHLVAWDLGDCRGTRAYRALEWYFPQYGQSFNPKQYMDICSGRYVGQ